MELSHDILFSIAIRLDLPDILNFCETNKKIDRKFFQLWIHKLNEVSDQESVIKIQKIQKRQKLREEEFKKLYTLIYSLNKVKESFKLEDNIYILYNLQKLNLSNNQISKIPEESLIWWRVAHVGVATIPVFLFHATTPSFPCHACGPLTTCMVPVLQSKRCRNLRTWRRVMGTSW